MTITDFSGARCTGTATILNTDLNNCSPPTTDYCKSYYKFTSTSGGTSPVTSPVTSLTKSPTASPVTSSTTFLTGYVTYISYKDSSCSNQLSATSDILNSCFRVDATTYRFVTATSSSVVKTTYTDSQCTKGATRESYSYTDGVCDASESAKVYVSSSSVWNSNSLAVTVR